MAMNHEYVNEIDFKDTKLDELPQRLEEARLAGQNVFIWDRTGVVSLYFDGVTADFTEQMVKVALAKKNQIQPVMDESLAMLQTQLVEAMQTGNKLLLNLGMLAPDFHNVYTNRDIFPAEEIFDSKRWRTRRCHQPYLRKANESTASSSSAATQPDTLTSPVMKK